MNIHPRTATTDAPGLFARRRRFSPRPDIPIEQHPISRMYWLPTPPVETFFNTVVQWVEGGFTGGTISGRPQLGKTHALQYTEKHLCGHLGWMLPIFLYSCPDSNRTIITEKKFFGDLLYWVDHDLSQSGDAATRRRRLINFLIERCMALGSPKVLLFVDEAQQLTSLHYTWLMAVHNALHQNGIRLITVLVGQPQLDSRRTDLLSEGEGQIIGRFMALRTQFTGLRSAADFEKTLTLFDLEEKFPLDSEWTYTRFFLPRAFDAGLRLANGAATMWTIFGNVTREAGLTKFEEIGMADFSRFVQCLLTLNMDRDHEKFELDEATLIDAIAYSGYVSRAVNSKPTLVKV